MSNYKPTVLTNSFPISRLPTKTFWHYDVDIERKIRDPKKKDNISAKRAHEIIDRLQTKNPIFQPRAVFDGKANLFATRELFKGGQTFDVDMAENPARLNGRGAYLVKMTPVGTIEPGVLNALITKGAPNDKNRMAVNVLQLLVRQAPSMRYPHNSRSVFTDAETCNLQGGLEVWRGYFQSVRPTLGKMVINIDTSTAVMYRHGSLINVAMEFIGSRNVRDLSQAQLRGPKWLQLQNFLKGLKVTFTTGGNRRRAIKSIVDRAGYEVFTKSEGEETSIINHYLEVHNIRLNHPNIFGVKTNSGAIYPAEICTVIPGQFYRRSISSDQTRLVLKFAVKKPHERRAMIEKAQNVLQYNSSDFISEAGMKIDFNAIKIVGNFLPPPSLEYGQGTKEMPKSGAWNLKQKRFIQPGTIHAWTVVIFDHRFQGKLVEDFVRTLISCCKTLGIVVPNGLPNARTADGNSDIGKILREEEMNAVKQAGGTPGTQHASIMICVLPSGSSAIHKQIKHWGDVVYGVPTQCVRGDKLIKAKEQYCSNVALKINVKLGGVNCVTRLNAEQPLMSWLNNKMTMVVGADVGHPGPGVMRPSITALVASVDQHANRYVAFSSIQEPRREIIDDLEQMMAYALDKFGQYWNGKTLPQHICFYRDGVSEGEFDAVAKEEVTKIKAAIDYVWTLRKVLVPKPTLTFVIVGKRHHVRFFPMNKADEDNSGNCRAGFAVDDQIVQPTGVEFYLQSHGGLLGTSRPGHYTVLYDDDNHTAKELQQFSYALCHTYARATRSVSIPAPVYYADLVCSRAHFHFKDLDFSDTSTIATNNSQSFTQAQLDEWKAAYMPVHHNQFTKMYWM